jgi:hypothetical protein
MPNALAILNPFDFFVGLDGLPLNGGYIYVGTAGIDPEISPVQLYWDLAGTQPATQPLRTSRGYLVNGAAPARAVVNGNYSLRVRDANGNQVYYETNVALLSQQTSFTLAGGTAAAPTYGFSGGAGTGMYSPGANQIAWSYGNVQAMLLSSGGLTINEPSSGPALTANGTVFNAAVYALGQTTSGQSFGLQVDGGTTSADYAVFVRNRGATQTLFRIRGDGSFVLGNNSGVTLLSSSGTDLGGRGISVVRYKAATTTITNNSTLADDPSLGAALGAGTYAFELWLPVWATTATNSLKWTMAFNGTQTSFYASAQYTAAGSLGQTAVVAPPGSISMALVVSATETGADWLRIDGTITVTVLGTLSFQEAQLTSNANSVNIGKGAWMKVTQLT